jgi:hypothetical protein
MNAAQARRLADAVERTMPESSIDELKYTRSLLRQLKMRRGLSPFEAAALAMLDADLRGESDGVVIDLIARAIRKWRDEVFRASETACPSPTGRDDDGAAS